MYAYQTSVHVASEYAHPVEDIIVNLSSTLGGPVLLGVHPIVFFLWMGLRCVYGHAPLLTASWLCWLYLFRVLLKSMTFP